MLGQIVAIVIYVVLGIAFVWLVLAKLVSRLAARFGVSSPCPYQLAFLVDTSWRKKRVDTILDRVGIQPGDRVLELGPGPGVFTVEAARRAGPEGTLHAVDIQPKMIDMVRERIREQGVKNVETHVGSALELPFENDSIDRAFLITVLPEIPNPIAALAEIKRVLKPDGIVSISEEFLDPDYPPISTTLFWGRESDLVPAGRFGSWWQYTVNLRKD